MGWPQQRIYKSPTNQNYGIGPLRCWDALGQSRVGDSVITSGIQILCKLFSDVRLLAMQVETILMTLPTKCQPCLPQLPSVKYR